MQLVSENNPILYERALEVFDVKTEVLSILCEFETILTSNSGIGLAAPQTGISKRFFITKVIPGMPKLYINPSIEASSLRCEDCEEGCLSKIGFKAVINRPVEVQVCYLNVQGELKREKLRGISARVFQHELDHGVAVTETEFL